MKKRRTPSRSSRSDRAAAGKSGARRPGRAGRSSGTAVMHTCGHEQKHALPKQAWKRTKDIEFQKQRPCTECWAAQQAEEAEDLCGVAPLPKLKGTSKQVLWARTVRGRFLSHLKGEAAQIDRLRRERGLEPASERFLDMVLPQALGERQAKWWIDHRDDGPASALFLSRDEIGTVEQIRMEGYCPF